MKNLTEIYAEILKEQYEDFKNVYWINPKTKHKNHIAYILANKDNPLYSKAWAYVGKIRAKADSDNPKEKKTAVKLKKTLTTISKEYAAVLKNKEKTGKIEDIQEKTKKHEYHDFDEFKDDMSDIMDNEIDPNDEDDVSLLDYVYSEASKPMEFDSSGKLQSDPDVEEKRSKIISQSLKKGNWNKLLVLLAITAPLLAWHVIKKYKKKFWEQDKEKWENMKTGLKDFITGEIEKTKSGY